jgi:hypothetical protein
MIGMVSMSFGANRSFRNYGVISRQLECFDREPPHAKQITAHEISHFEINIELLNPTPIQQQGNRESHSAPHKRTRASVSLAVFLSGKIWNTARQ